MGRKKPISGLVTALVTPFHTAGSVDLDALSELIRFQIARGTEGLYPCGTTGLGPLLNMEERKNVAEVVVRETSGRVPVVVQVGCADTASTIELAKHAEEIGATAVASLTPYYYKPGNSAMIRHFERVSESVDIPLFAYNIPQFTGNSISPAVLARLARRKTIAGVKDSSRDFLELQEYLEAVPKGFIVMNGTEEYGLFAMMVGADGLVSGGANAFPEVFAELVSAYRAGDYKRGLEAQRRVIEIKKAVEAGPIAAYYEILRLRGLDCGSPRAPILPAGNAFRDRLKRSLSKQLG